jgi:hypothetical protein
MVEQVGTTTNFDMSVDEIIELALEGIGGEHITHKEAKLARTCLNLIFIDLQNRGMAPLASMEIASFDLVSGSSENYTMSSDAFNILDAVVRVSTSSGRVTDLPIQRLSYDEWLDIPTKDSTGRPTHYLVDRQRDNIYLNFWPTPNNSTFSFRAWSLKRIADVNKSYQLVDLPHRYLPAIVKGLRYYMADLRGAPLEERTWLKGEYYETLQMALDEDRERVSFDIYPSNKGQLTRG